MENLGLGELFAGIYTNRNVLVTGHTGFKGSWLCFWLRAMGARVTGLALAPDTEPSHWTLLGLDGVEDLRVDVRDASSLRQTILRIRPEVIFHLAAQPLVRRSYETPQVTFETNVIGLVNLLESIRDCSAVEALVNVTTDKVYLDQPSDNGYREDAPLGGHDPYSTSKACAELVSACYRKSYFSGLAGKSFRSATVRAGNVIGGGDWSADRLVPDMMRAIFSGGALQIRNPGAVRPWQHVLEPISGYLRLAQGLLNRENVEGAWNFGPATDASVPVSELVARLKADWPHLRVESQPGPHPHEAESLKLDCSKAQADLSWRPVWDVATTLRRTSAWYRAFYESGRLRTAEDLTDYVRAARDAGLGWAA